MSDDMILVIKLKQKDSDAFNSLYLKYVDRLYAFALSVLKSQQLAEDVVHDVFVKLWEKSDDLNPELSFQSWLFTVTRNHMLNMIKRASKEQSILGELLSNALPNHDHVMNQIQGDETNRIIHEAIQNLPDKRRQIFILCRFHDYTYKEAAKVLGITESTVNSQMVKAIRSIKSFLENRNRIAVAIIGSIFYI